MTDTGVVRYAVSRRGEKRGDVSANARLWGACVVEEQRRLPAHEPSGKRIVCRAFRQRRARRFRANCLLVGLVENCCQGNTLRNRCRVPRICQRGMPRIGNRVSGRRCEEPGLIRGSVSETRRLSSYELAIKTVAQFGAAYTIIWHLLVQHHARHGIGAPQGHNKLRAVPFAACAHFASGRSGD